MDEHASIWMKKFPKNEKNLGKSKNNEKKNTWHV
jgi:hypothetical protein